ncbi:MAG: MBL fold metallo-hydrolase [Candidatus Heimdallarchaeaceae archaeon]
MIGEPIKTINESITIIEGEPGKGGELNRGYLLGTEQFAIIDTGNKGTIETTFQKAVFDKGKDVKDVKYIFLTHPHPDTMGGVYRLRKLFPNAQIAINEKCEEVLKSPRSVLKKKYFEFTRKDSLYFAIKKDPFDDLERIQADIYFKDGEKFDLGDTRIMAINFDGHCLGHTMFFATKERAMFVGDALNLYPALPHSYLIDRSGSYKSWLKNIEFLLKAKISIICPNHDQYQEGRHVVPYIRDVLDAFNEYENQLEMVFSEQKYLTLNALIERVHSAQGIIWYHPYTELAPRANMLAHLAKLIDEGKVQKNTKSDPVTYTWIGPKEEYFY